MCLDCYWTVDCDRRDSRGGMFLVLSLYRSIASGGPSMSHLNPIGVMTVIGVTVGALIGPLAGAIVGRLRHPPE